MHLVWVPTPPGGMLTLKDYNYWRKHYKPIWKKGGKGAAPSADELELFGKKPQVGSCKCTSGILLKPANNIAGCYLSENVSPYNYQEE